MTSYFLEVHEPMHLAAAAADSAMPGPSAAEQRAFQALEVLDVLSRNGVHEILPITCALSSVIWPAQPRVRVLRCRVRVASAQSYLVNPREATWFKLPWRRPGGGGRAVL